MPHTYPQNSENPPGRHEVSETFQEIGQELKAMPGEFARGFCANAKESLTQLVSLPLLIPVAIVGIPVFGTMTAALAAAWVVLPIGAVVGLVNEKAGDAIMAAPVNVIKGVGIAAGLCDENGEPRSSYGRKWI